MNGSLWLFDFFGMILLLLESTFERLNQFNKKRSNPLIGLSSSKLLAFIVSERGIEAFKECFQEALSSFFWGLASGQY